VGIRYIILVVVTSNTEKRLNMTVDDMNDDTLAWLLIRRIWLMYRNRIAVHGRSRGLV